MPTITRPDAEQIKFISSKTGEQVLDTYMEAAEIGNRSLSDLLGDLFDAGTGQVKSGLVQFRLNNTTRQLETRSGTYVDPEDGWAGSGAYFSRFMGDWAPSQQYRASDYVRISGVTYLVTADHISGASPDFSKLIDILGNPLLSAIGSLTGAANKLPYFTGTNTAATTDITAYGRSLLALTDAAANRSALGLGTGATMSLSSVPAMTMAGTLTLNADPSLGLQAATKQYVDAQVATRAAPLGFTPVNRAGDSMAGALTLASDPTAALHAATKQYVDAQVGGTNKVSKTGDTMSGNLTVNASIVANSIFVGANAVWHAGNLTPSFYALLTGATFTGPIISTSVGPFRSSGDIGMAFANWNTSGGAALQVDAPNNASAYQVWRATKQGTRHLAGMSVYSGGSDATQPIVRFHVGSTMDVLALGEGAFTYLGNGIWHAGNFNPSNYAPTSNPTFSGNVSMNSSNAGLELGAPGSSNTPFIDLHSSGTSNDYDVRLIASGGNSSAGNGTLTITASGGVWASHNIIAYSDRRVKKDIEPIRGALAKLLQIVGVSYTRIDTNEREIGVIAQDVDSVFPEAVSESGVSGTKTLGVAYGNLVGPVIEAIRELASRVEALEAA